MLAVTLATALWGAALPAWPVWLALNVAFFNAVVARRRAAAIASVIIHWPARHRPTGYPVFLNNGTITGYTAAASPGVASCSTTTATLCTISGLTDGTPYTITVTVTATTGTASGSTVTVTPVGFLTLTSPSSLT